MSAAAIAGFSRPVLTVPSRAINPTYEAATASPDMAASLVYFRLFCLKVWCVITKNTSTNRKVHQVSIAKTCNSPLGRLGSKTVLESTKLVVRLLKFGAYG